MDPKKEMVTSHFNVPSKHTKIFGRNLDAFVEGSRRNVIKFGGAAGSKCHRLRWTQCQALNITVFGGGGRS